MRVFQKFASKVYRRGSVAIEYALILPVLLLFTLGIVDTGRVLWTYTTLYRAVEAAARCAAINITECGTKAQIQSYAVKQAWGLPVNPSTFTVTTQSCGVKVDAAYDFTFIVPGLYMIAPLGTLRLNATACYPAGT